jgi:hypothetical protein
MSQAVLRLLKTCCYDWSKIETPKCGFRVTSRRDRAFSWSVHFIQWFSVIKRLNRRVRVDCLSVPQWVRRWESSIHVGRVLMPRMISWIQMSGNAGVNSNGELLAQPYILFRSCPKMGYYEFVKETIDPQQTALHVTVGYISSSFPS